jgi:hypothetical protein
LEARRGISAFAGPRHVDAQRDAHIAKFWLHPVRLDYNRGLQSPEIRLIDGIITGNHTSVL